MNNYCRLKLYKLVEMNIEVNRYFFTEKIIETEITEIMVQKKQSLRIDLLEISVPK